MLCTSAQQCTRSIWHCFLQVKIYSKEPLYGLSMTKSRYCTLDSPDDASCTVSWKPHQLILDEYASTSSTVKMKMKMLLMMMLLMVMLMIMMMMLITDKGVNKWQQSRAGSSDTMCYKWDDDHEDDDVDDDDEDDDDDDDEHRTFDIWDYGWIDFYREFYRDKYDINQQESVDWLHSVLIEHLVCQCSSKTQTYV